MSRTNASKGSARAAVLAAAAAVALGVALAAWLAVPREARLAGVGPSVGAGADRASGSSLALEEDLAERERGESASAALGLSSAGLGVRLPGPGRLEGRVIDRANGAGVAEARVELLALPPAGRDFFERALRLARVGPAVERRTLPIAAVLSNGEGNFRFEGVREGRYYLDARCVQHVPEAPRLVEVAASGAGGPVELWVRAGGGVRGRFVRGDEGVANATVLLLQGPGLALDAARSGSLRALETRTDSSGAFAFRGVAPGRGYEISALGSGTTSSHALDLEVRAGIETEVLVEARTGGSIAGRVVSIPKEAGAGAEDAEPVPLEGARIAAVPRGLRDLRFAEELLGATLATSDANGAFVLGRVPPGEVDLLAYAPGHLGAVGGPCWVSDGARCEASDVELEAGPSVAGRVVDVEGRPIAGAQVRWNTFDVRELGRNGFEIRFAPFLMQAIEGFDFPLTGADGSFVAGPFPGEPPFRIQFHAPGFQDARERWTPGEGDAELEVVMHRGGSVEGVVMDLDEAKPVTRFRIQTMDRIELAADEPGRFNPFAGGTLVEDPAGRFRVAPVRAGKVALGFYADGYVPTVLEEVEVAEGGGARGFIVKMVRGGTVRGTVVDPDGAPIAGAQVLALSGSRASGRGRERFGPGFDFVEEIPPALLDYAAGVGLLAERSVRSAADGTFELAGLEAGSARVVALHPGHVPGRSDELEIVAGETIEGVRIELGRGGSLYGKVEDRHGRPLGGSMVFAAAPARFRRPSASNFGGGLYQGLANERGEYRIERMSAGSYFVVATRGDEELDPMSLLSSFDFDLVSVPPDEAVRFDLVDQAAGATRVFGRVTDGGAPVERGSLTAVGFESDNLLGVDLKLARLREGGEYEFPGLSPGEYQLELQGRGSRARMTIDVPDAPECRIDLELPSGSIEGRVVDASTGEGVSRCDLALRPRSDGEGGSWIASMLRSQGRVLRARCDAEGAFRFERLEEGEYELVASPRAREDGARLGASEPLAIELRRGERERHVEITLLPALGLEGVVSGERGEPIAGARVTALAENADDPRPPRARSGEDGRFTIEGVGAGVYALLASADGYASTRVDGVRVDADSRDEVRLELERGVSVNLRVFGADGRPLAGARGRLSQRGASGVQGADLDGALRQLFGGEDGTGADGRIELGRFAPGEYELEVWRGFARTKLASVVLERGSSAVELAVTMP